MKKYFLSLLGTLFLSLSLLTGCSAKQLSYSYPQKKAASGQQQRNIRLDAIFGQVVHISDGDTITVQQKDGQRFKIRLYAIDAPEKAQPYGPQSTGILRNLIGNQYVNIRVINQDRYGRNVGRVYLNNQDMNAEMIKLGAAWHYKYYDKSTEYDRYAQLENNARANHKGLWNKPNPLAPWDFRKMVREKSGK